MQQVGLTTNALIVVIILNFRDFTYYQLIIQYSSLMLIFNLCPIYPLDGYLIIDTLLATIYEEDYRFDLLYMLGIIFIIIIFIVIIITRSLGLLIIWLFLAKKAILRKRHKRAYLLLNKINNTKYFKLFPN